ncbi:MAG: MFS transporter [Ilumatobacteraceae bacterium]
MTVSRGTRIVTRSWALNPQALSTLTTPRNDIVREAEPTIEDGGTYLFLSCEGPFSHWERRVTSTDDTITEHTNYRIDIPWFGWVFFLPILLFVRRSGAPPTSTHQSATSLPWWAPTDRLNARQVKILGLLAAAAMSSAFTNTVFTQTVTFAADDFGVGNTGVGIAGALVRAGILITIPLAIAGDRIGRRKVVVAMAWAAPLVTAAGALAPNFPLLVATQSIGRPLGLALDFLIAVIAAEEMPRGSRAYAVAIMAMASGLGAGVAVMALPLTDLGPSGWRWVFAITLVWLVIAVDIARRLPESQRFSAPHAEHVRLHRQRFATLAAILVGVNLLVAPASLFQNRYLSDVRELSGTSISLFSLATATPAAIGLILGGRAADRRGRRHLIAVSLPCAAVLIVASFSVGGVPMWITAFGGGLLGGVAYPALAVYRAELFPTGNRSRAAGLLTVAALLGGIGGLLGAGALLDQGWDYRSVMGVLMVGQFIAVVLVLTGLPETAQKELEDIS